LGIERAFGRRCGPRGHKSDSETLEAQVQVNSPDNHVMIDNYSTISNNQSCVAG
jgi:hypothetical protein